MGDGKRLIASPSRQEVLPVCRRKKKKAIYSSLFNERNHVNLINTFVQSAEMTLSCEVYCIFIPRDLWYDDPRKSGLPNKTTKNNLRATV